MKRYSTLFFKDPDFVANIAAKVDAGEKVWLMQGEGKRARPVLVTSAYKYDKPDALGA